MENPLGAVATGGIAAGVVVGVIVGVVVENVAVGIGVGLAIGVAFGGIGVAQNDRGEPEERRARRADTRDPDRR